VTLAAIFVADLSLPFGYAGSILYVVLIMVTVLSDRAWLVLASAAGALLATIVTFGVKGSDPVAVSPTMVSFNRIGILALIAAMGVAGALIVRRGQRARALSHEIVAVNHLLTRQDRLVAAAQEMGRIGGWAVSLEDGAVEWSHEIAAIHGFDPEEPLTWDQVVAHYVPADRERLTAAFSACAQNGTPFAEECRVRSEDGSDTWIMCVGEAARSNDGTIAEVHGAIQDVTIWKEAERKAADQSHRFTQLTSSLTFIVWISSPQGEVDYFNQALITYTGMSESELLNDQWISTIHPDDKERAQARWIDSLMAGASHEDEYRLKRADGEYRWHRVRGVPERNRAGDVERWWGHAIDIHDYLVVKDEAQRLAVDRDLILQSIGDGVLTVDREWRLTYMNTNAERRLKVNLSEVDVTSLWDVFPDVLGTPIESAYRRAMDGAEVERFTEYYPPLEGWFEISANPSPTGLTVFFRDVTEFRVLSEQLQQAQRLESVGRLTGGIAHDFNNLLTVVMGGIEALATDEPDLSPGAHDMLSLISKAAGRGAELTNHLLAFARRQPLEPQAVDASARVGDLLPLLKRTIGEGVAMITDLSKDLPHAHVDPAQLESALLNLCINARDAMPEGGTLSIETSSVQLDEAHATVHGEVLPGAYVVIAVSDTGTGIALDHFPRLFDPFFTTKPVGQGSGLGLPMVWGFAKQSGGHVTVYSETDHGSTFRLYLPLAPSDAAKARTQEPRLIDDSQGEGIILLVEDDVLVQQFAAQQLRSRGYAVTVAGSGPEALDRLEYMDHIDLLFTDVVMPGGLTGRQLSEQVRALRPDLPVLFTSGYTEDVIVHSGRLDQGVSLLPKPYSSRQLGEAIQVALAAAKEAAA
jgi:PAS domain S-box-containing protein